MSRLLIIDEVAGLALETAQPSLVAEAIRQRFDRRQTMIGTISRAFTDWEQVFAKDATIAPAVFNRLLTAPPLLKIRCQGGPQLGACGVDRNRFADGEWWIRELTPLIGSVTY